MAIFTNERETEQMPTEDGSTETIIGPSVRVEGNFEGKGNVVVEGAVNGSLRTTKHLRVGAQAKIKADVEAESVHASGEIRGNVKAAKTVELTSSAKVYGNIETSSLSVQAGAVFNGKSVMGAKEQHSEEPDSHKKSNKTAK